MCPVCPHVCSMFARAHGPSNLGLVKIWPGWRRIRGRAPGSGPLCPVGAVPTPLDQWSRPLRRAPGARPESPMPMPSRSVKTAAHAAFRLPRRLRQARPATKARHVRVWGRRGVPGVTTTAAGSAGSHKSAGCSRLRPVPGMQGGRAARPSRRHVPWLRPGMRFGPGDRACGDDRMPAVAIGRAGQAEARAATVGPGARGRRVSRGVS